MISLWVTNKCNLKCKYCYVDDSKGTNDFGCNIEKFVEFAIKNSKDSLDINFFGGEPLVAFDLIKQIVETFNKKKIEAMYFLTTNGTLLTKEISDFLADNKFAVSLSLDGNKRIHDLNRVFVDGSGSYDLAVLGKKILEESGNRNIRIRGTVNSDTVMDLENSIEHLLSIGCEEIVMVPDFFDEKWNEEKIEIYGKVYRKYKDDKRVSLYSREEKATLCGGGTSDFYIDVHGDVYPCSYVVGEEKFVIGNIDTGLDLMKINTNRVINKKRIEECVNCAREKYCHSFKCKYLNYRLMGDMLKPSPIICNLENICNEHL